MDIIPLFIPFCLILAFGILRNVLKIGRAIEEYQNVSSSSFSPVNDVSYGEGTKKLTPIK